MRSLLWTAAAVGALLLAVAVIPVTRAFLLDLLPPTWRTTLSAWRHGIEIDHGIRTSMSDGVELRASLYRPRGSLEPLPTILMREPYDRLTHSEGFYGAFLFARAGYAVLVQDLRGTGESQGTFMPWQHAGDDGVATLDWIAHQPWSDGKIGTFGCSAYGETQLVLAARNHPRHLAMIPSGAGGAVGAAAGRHGYAGLFEGGIFQLASGFGWFVDHGATHPGAPRAIAFDRAAHLRTLPVSTLVQRVRPSANGYEAFVTTRPGAPEWARWGYLADADRSTVPALVINTWGDQTVGDTLALAESWRRADPGAAATRQRVVIGPGIHCGHEPLQPSIAFGELKVHNANWPHRQWYLAWFDYWLRGRGDGLAAVAPYTYFMLGENRWLSAHEWPPSEARLEKWYLASSGRANSRSGDGTLGTRPAAGDAFDEFRYDPENPVPTRGGPICCTGMADTRAGPADQAEVEVRDDVLVYTSAPLDRALRIAGPLQLRLGVSSSAPDTDLVARLVHVFPDGRALGIQEGALRLRYRDGFDRPTLMEPGARYQATVDMRAIAYAIPRGHRLRLHVTSSSFPRLERNLNTGAAVNAASAVARVATTRIYHGARDDSHLVLRVLPAQ